MTSQKYPEYPIFTLPLGLTRMYVVTAPHISTEIQRNNKTLQFDPMVPELLPRVLGMDSKAVAILKNNCTQVGGRFGILADIHQEMASAMATGPTLDNMLVATVDELRVELRRNISAQPVDLLEWTMHIFTLATARALYGPQNPIAVDPSLEADFWQFDRNLGLLLINIFPKITARGPFYARERCVQGFKEYVSDEKRMAQASRVIQRRFVVVHNNGFDTDATARSELSFLFAGVVNTAISAFWLVLHIFSDPELLADVRREVDEAGLDPTILRNKAPLLSSALSECLRLASDTNSQRLVLADTMIQDKKTGESYKLHANSVVQISAAAMHSDPRFWDDASAFNPRRFLDGKLPLAWRPFGGGVTHCPGRHLATVTVLGWAALVVSLLDIESADGTPLKVPEKEDRRLPVHVCESKEKVVIKMKKRKGRG